MNQENDADIRTYDHTKKILFDACGISEERLEDIVSLAFQFVKESETLSELTEKLEKSFTKRELALIATQHILDAYKKSKMLAKFFKDSFL